MALNCGALPETLLESELFGHVRGAFTGAATTKKGLLEAAEGGTVFLDEIGEMSPMMQVKLLRVLQERKFRRVGGTEEIEADVRIIAATNRDLAKAGGRGRVPRGPLLPAQRDSRSHLPPLRERREDIPPLAEHFLASTASRWARPSTGLTPEALQWLEASDWPGNVRELENVIERAVALERGPLIQVPACRPTSVRSPTPGSAPRRRARRAPRARARPAGTWRPRSGSLWPRPWAKRRSSRQAAKLLGDHAPSVPLSPRQVTAAPLTDSGTRH